MTTSRFRLPAMLLAFASLGLPASAQTPEQFYKGKQIELAIGPNGPAALRPLDVLTPRAWEVAAQ